MFRILVINPGAGSTKIGVFDDDNPVFQKSIEHDASVISSFHAIADQYEFRKEVLISVLAEASISISSLDAAVGRGGLLYPLEGGTYSVNERMLTDLRGTARGEHASNLGPILAHEIAKQADIPAFTVDPVAVDEMEDVARVSGHPELPRHSLSHALNSKAIARKAAHDMGKAYTDAQLIVVHLGTGVTVSVHRGSRMIDVNNSREEGPFGPDRSGTLPAHRLVEMCFSGKKSKDEMMKLFKGDGGLQALLGTKDFREAISRAEKGDKEADLIVRAFVYQVAKEIGAVSTVLKGEVECIAVTGGIAWSDHIVSSIKERVGFIAPLRVYPGEEELVSLASGALRVLKGEENAKEYKGNQGDK